MIYLLFTSALDLSSKRKLNVVIDIYTLANINVSFSNEKKNRFETKFE